MSLRHFLYLLCRDVYLLSHGFYLLFQFIFFLVHNGLFGYY
jgi:hypothetical protein